MKEKINEDDKLTEHFAFRLTSCESKRLKKWAKHFNLPPSIYVRQMVLNKLTELEAQK